MKRLLLFFLASVSAFSPVVKEGVVIRGSTPPLKEFDPLGFSEKKDIAYLREAELKHGRWGMISATSIPLIESVTHQPAIYMFDRLDSNSQLLILTTIAASEFQLMLNGWRNPIKYPFTLQDNYQPGNLGFSIVKDFNYRDNALTMNKELNNGRLAMIASIGMIVQELVTNQPLFP